MYFFSFHMPLHKWFCLLVCTNDFVPLCPVYLSKSWSDIDHLKNNFVRTINIGFVNLKVFSIDSSIKIEYIICITSINPLLFVKMETSKDKWMTLQFYIVMQFFANFVVDINSECSLILIWWNCSPRSSMFKKTVVPAIYFLKPQKHSSLSNHEELVSNVLEVQNNV